MNTQFGRFLRRLDHSAHCVWTHQGKPQGIAVIGPQCPNANVRFTPWVTNSHSLLYHLGGCFRLYSGQLSHIPRLHRFFFGLLRRLPLFRSHRRLLLAFFLRIALFGHAVCSLSVPQMTRYASESRPSALGHKQPYKVVVILACERLVYARKQSLIVAIPRFRDSKF